MRATHPTIAALDSKPFVLAYDNYARAELLRPLADKVGIPIRNMARPDQFRHLRANFGRDYCKAIVDNVDLRKLAEFAVSDGCDAETAYADAEFMIAGQVPSGRGKADTERKVRAALLSSLICMIQSLTDHDTYDEFGDYCALVALSLSMRA